MIRDIITIDGAKCDGCGSCVRACHEGALGIVDGKARLLREDFCDGLGNCLPVCPKGAIAFERREAPVFALSAQDQGGKAVCVCPGTMAGRLVAAGASKNGETGHDEGAAKPEGGQTCSGRLNQWPIQIKLVPVQASFFSGADLLIAADCTAYAHANFHRDFIQHRITLIGCPKLDSGNDSEKLTAILRLNDILSVTIVRMEVPCCAGIVSSAMRAISDCGKQIPWQVVTVTRDGRVLEG